MSQRREDIVRKAADATARARIAAFAQDQITTIERHIAEMKAYLALVVEREDWHGVMDAAADIRELVARRNTLLGVISECAS